MGMDVMGRAPDAEVGGYFRNSVWWWSPLADFLTTQYPDLTQYCECWFTNDGDGLDGPQSAALAVRLRADLDLGVVGVFAELYAASLAALPDLPCDLCADEGDPVGGPVAMRLGVGGSWSTVERTRMG